MSGEILGYRQGRQNDVLQARFQQEKERRQFQLVKRPTTAISNSLPGARGFTGDLGYGRQDDRVDPMYRYRVAKATHDGGELMHNDTAKTQSNAVTAPIAFRRSSHA